MLQKKYTRKYSEYWCSQFENSQQKYKYVSRFIRLFYGYYVINGSESTKTLTQYFNY